MLGKNKSVDDRFSDLWENAKIKQHLAQLVIKIRVRQTCLHHMSYSPSEGVWLLMLGVNPDVLSCQLSLLLSVSSRIPEIIFNQKEKNDN